MKKAKNKRYDFRNVRVTVLAPNAKAAYDILCRTLDRGAADFETFAYVELDAQGVYPQRGLRPTTELYPKPGSKRALDNESSRA